MIVSVLSIAWIVLSILVVLTTALSAAPGTAWQLRICDFPRAQILVIGIALLAAGFGLILAGRDVPGGTFSLPVFGLLGLGVIVQGCWAVRLTPLVTVEIPSHPSVPRSDRPGPPPSGALRVVTANVDFTNRDPAGALAALLRHRPHLLAIVENTGAWDPEFEKLAGTFPWRLVEPRPDGRGVALLSRVPLQTASLDCLVTDDRPSIWASVKISEGTSLGVAVLHPAPPGLPKRWGGRQDSKKRDIELHVAAQRIRDADPHLPWIATGDFNDVGWSRTTEHFKRVSGLGDPRIGRGAFSTFPATWPLLRYPIDHVMLSVSLRVVQLRRLDAIGSDHLPLLTDVMLDSGPVWPDPKTGSGDQNRLVYHTCSGETEVKESRPRG